MLAPYRKIGFGNTGVCTQNKNYRLRLRQQTHGKFGLGTNRVQTGRVQNDQPLFEQRVCDVDQGVAPLGHLHQALRVHQGVVFRRMLVPQAQRAGVLLGDHTRLRHHLQRGSELTRVIHVEVNTGPLLGHHAPFHQGLRQQARLDRQQTQTRRNIGVVAHFGRAHGGAPSAGRHDATAISGKEYGVDELRLAARELSNECHHDLVGANLVLQPAQAFFNPGVEQIVVFHPLGQQLQTQAELATPRAMLVKLLVE